MAEGGNETVGEPQGMASASTVHGRVVVYPVRDCPVTRLAAEYGLRTLVTPDRFDRAPQAVVETTETARLRELGAHPVVRAGDVTVCRLPTLERSTGDVTAPACGHDHCLAHGFGFLPIDPYHVRWEDDHLHCSFAALDTGEIEAAVHALGDADFVVKLQQLVQSGDADGGAGGHTAVVDLDRLTDRQREVAAAAAERGYFDPDGPTAATVAEELGVSKSTLSEHLRVVQRELLRQTFTEA
ncbi:helix-turn-helix domain-containing protein [Halorarius halobius]|uniref:helix-turn-helix domain-containing protein n=1 Tax=Halorarius halobius TaxID=2962671 RepID=UPI0020CB9D58|nr:helix-turn-helix domain-containing protein [Halorarius halobius]